MKFVNLILLQPQPENNYFKTIIFENVGIKLPLWRFQNAIILGMQDQLRRKEPLVDKNTIAEKADFSHHSWTCHVDPLIRNLQCKRQNQRRYIGENGNQFKSPFSSCGQAES